MVIYKPYNFFNSLSGIIAPCSKLVHILLGAALLAGCNQNDPELNSTIPEHIAVVAQEGFGVKLAEINTLEDDVILEDYTAQFIDARGRKFIDYTSKYVSIIYYEFPRIEFWRKHFDTGEILTGIIYEIESDEYIFDATSDSEHAFLILDKIQENENVERKLITTTLTDMSIRRSIDIASTKNTLFGANYLATAEDHLLAYSTDRSQVTKIFKISKERQVKVDSISLENNPVVIASDDFLHSFNQSNIHEIYSLDNLELISSTTFDYNIVAAPEGFRKSFIQDQKVVVDYSYAQPFPLISVPVEVNLSDGTILNNDLEYLLRLIVEFESQNGHGISLTTYSVDLSAGVLVFGYRSLQGASLGPSGGVVITNFNGDLLEHFKLNVIPTEIILR